MVAALTGAGAGAGAGASYIPDKSSPIIFHTTERFEPDYVARCIQEAQIVFRPVDDGEPQILTGDRVPKNNCDIPLS